MVTFCCKQKKWIWIFSAVLWTVKNSCNISHCALVSVGYKISSRINILNLIYRKVTSRSTSRLVACQRIIRLFMKGKFDAYVLWNLAKKAKLNSSPVHRDVFCQFAFLWIYYYGSNKSTRNKTGKTQLCAVYCSRLYSSPKNSCFLFT